MWWAGASLGAARHQPDPNCGWTRGKADVVYVADAFQVMAKVQCTAAGAQFVARASDHPLTREAPSKDRRSKTIDSDGPQRGRGGDPDAPVQMRALSSKDASAVPPDR